MEGQQKQRWLDVCAEAAICDDPIRLLELTREIITILRREEQRLELHPPTHTAA